MHYKDDQEESSSEIRHGAKKVSLLPEEPHLVTDAPAANDIHQTLTEAAQILGEHQGQLVSEKGRVDT